MAWLALHKRFVATALVVAAVLALMGVVFGYALRYIRTNWQILAATRRDLKAAEERRGRILGASRTLQGLEDEIRALEGAFADPRDPLPFIESVEALGRRSGITLELDLASVRPGSIRYDIVATGGLGNLFAFWQHLESLPMLVSFGDAELVRIGRAQSSGRSGGSEPELQLRLVVQPLNR